MLLLFSDEAGCLEAGLCGDGFLETEPQALAPITAPAIHSAGRAAPWFTA